MDIQDYSGKLFIGDLGRKVEFRTRVVNNCLLLRETTDYELGYLFDEDMSRHLISLYHSGRCVYNYTLGTGLKFDIHDTLSFSRLVPVNVIRSFGWLELIGCNVYIDSPFTYGQKLTLIKLMNSCTLPGYFNERDYMISVDGDLL